MIPTHVVGNERRNSNFRNRKMLAHLLRIRRRWKESGTKGEGETNSIGLLVTFNDEYLIRRHVAFPFYGFFLRSFGRKTG